MCLAIPAQIVEINKHSAKIDIMGVKSEVNVDLIEKPKAGDFILVHAGCAIQKIDIDYFNELQEIFQTVLEVQSKNEQANFD